MGINMLKSTWSALCSRRSYATKTYHRVSHCIFDMDGLIIDTERVYKKMITLLCEKYRSVYTKELAHKVLGRTEQSLSEILCKELHLPISPVEFRDELLCLGDRMLSEAPLLPGVRRLICHLHFHQIPMAIATNSSERAVKTKISGYEDVFSMFNHKVMGSSDPEVKAGKPSPDIYLVAAARFPDKPKPDMCLVFEDSPHGVTAGIAAGMQVVMVPDPRGDPEESTHATMVLRSLLDFKPHLFGIPQFPV